MIDDLIELPPWEWPEDARARLLAALARGPLEERCVAAELLGSIADDGIGDALLARAQDEREDPELRSAAASALGPGLERCDIDGFDDPYSEPAFSRRTFNRIAEALERVYRDANAPAEVRRAALEAAVSAPRKWQSAAIRASWSSGDPGWRRAAVYCMGFVKGFGREVKEALESGDQELIDEVVRAATRGIEEVAAAAEPHLLRVAESDEDPELRLDAITALSHLQSERSEEVLERLTESEEPDIADAASEALEIRRMSAELPD